MKPRYGHSSIGGKLSAFTALIGVGVIFFGLIANLPHDGVARANIATTSVVVLNTPPTWMVSPQETPASSTTTPTNTGSNITWTATANDSSGDNYYLLICKTSVAPTPTDGGPPECNGGFNNRWARSAATATGTQATAATTTYEINPEFNDWFGWICDGANPNASCNSEYRQGNNLAASPFVVNHRPVFTVFVNDSPHLPGEMITWFATATDPDSYGGASPDTLILFVCKANDFTGSNCGPGGSWATTSPPTAPDAIATTTTTIPEPDGTFAAYGFVIDTHGGHAALGGVQGANRSLIISNVTPTIASSSIFLLDTDDVGPLTLTGMATQTPGFEVRYTVTDQNSCKTASSTDEIVFGLVDVYRSDLTQSGCNSAGQYNPNQCYPGSVGSFTWNVTCTQTVGSCVDADDSDAIWSCVFPLWFLADATDGTGIATDPPHWNDKWMAAALAADNNYATSAPIETETGNELNSFLAYNVSTTSIAYGGLQPTQFTSPIGDTVLKRTDLQAWGNVGLDETLYGTSMCPTYPSCPVDPTSTIPVGEQVYASSSLAYASAIPLLADPGAEFETNVRKSTSTSSPAATTTYWGINVPGTITLSGDYIGENTIVAITGESAEW